MKQYVCSVCGYVYDEEKGIPEAGIAPGTRFEDLPADWVCPLCKASKNAFRESGAETSKTSAEDFDAPDVKRELSPMEMSVICSNLARGCEKQYMQEEADGFLLLAEYFLQNAEPVYNVDTASLLSLIEKDLKSGYPYANVVSAEKPDRGALRSLVWSEKVTRMLDSLLSRYEAEGDKMLENTGVYVCTICGFVYVGDEPPEICPVCKVPAYKFEKIEGRA